MVVTKLKQDRSLMSTGVLLRLEVGFSFVYFTGSDILVPYFSLLACALFNLFTERRIFVSGQFRQRLLILHRDAILLWCILSGILVISSPRFYSNDWVRGNFDWVKLIALSKLLLWGSLSFVILRTICLSLDHLLDSKSASKPSPSEA